MDSDKSSDIYIALLADHELAEAEKFPKFAKLLKHLNGYISMRGTSNHLEKQMDEVKGQLTVAKFNYLQNATIYNEIKEIQHEFCVQKLERVVFNELTKLHDKIQDILVQSEVKHKLKCLQLKEAGSDKCKYGLLGLAISDKSSQKQSLTAEEVKSLQTALHKRLQTRCTDLAKFYDRMINVGREPDYLFPNEKLSTKQCYFFSSLLESKKQELETKKEKLEFAQFKKQRLILKYYRTLKDTTGAMMQLGEICTSNDRNFRRSKFLTIHSELLLLKIRTFYLEILVKIYTENAVKVHLRMKQYIDEAIAKTQADKVVTERRLAAYESVDSQFHNLLNEYVDVMSQIDNRTLVLNSCTEYDMHDTKKDHINPS